MIVKTIGNVIKIGYSGKRLGNVNPRFGADGDANFAKFKAQFPGYRIYDLPATGKDSIVEVDDLTPEQVFESGVDGLITKDVHSLLVLRAADCIPVVFYVPGQKILGLAHIGTSGAALHLPRKMVGAMGTPADLHIYVGPHISRKSYRFEPDKFEKKLDQSWDKYIGHEADGVHIDLLNYVLDELKAAGVKTDNIQLSPVDTGADPGYFSHRRHKLTGEPDGRNCFAVCLV